MNRSTILRLAIIALLAGCYCEAHISAQESNPVGEATKPAEGKSEPIAAPPLPAAETKMPEIVGTWSRAESGTFSKLAIWPVENREFLFFVEGADGNGLLEWKPAHFNFQGFFTFNLLGDWTAQASLAAHGPKEMSHLMISPFEGQRKQLLRSDFAKTERELDQKLSSDWTRVEAPVQPIPMTTVTVVKTEFEPARIRELLRAKYHEQPYRFFSNDTLRSVIVLAPAEAQEDIEVLIHKLDIKEEPDDVAASPNIAQAVPANPLRVNSHRPDEVVPDISGTWSVAIWYHENGKYEPVEAGEMEVRRLGVANFLIDQPGVEKATRIFVQWSAPNRRFQGVWDNGDGGHSKITLQPATDINTLRVIVTKTQSAKETRKEGGAEQAAVEELASQQWPQDWTRKSLTISANLTANLVGQSDVVTNAVSVGKTLDNVAHARAIPNTPAAKQLVEQLGAQESAAAAEAATIRQLQAGGQAEQNKQPIAEHQRKLKNLLNTAFDLKLQLEELQVKELQSRLSRLERQIGQRKELREKIITRRAGELIEGEVLRWSPSAPLITRENEGGGSERGSPLRVPPTSGQPSRASVTSPPPAGMDETVVIDLYSGAKVLPTISKTPKHSKLLRSLNSLKGVVTNIREVQVDDPTIILTAIVRDPSQRCLRESQRTQKESELRAAINSALKEAGVAVRWEEGTSEVQAAHTSASGTEAAVDPSAKPDPLPSPEELRDQLEPFVTRAAAAEERVRELEAIYYQDRSHAAELQRAFDEMTKSRQDLRGRWKAIEPSLMLITVNYESAKMIADSLGSRVESVMKQLADGKATEAELTEVVTSWKRAGERCVSAKSTAEPYNAVLEKLTPVNMYDDESFSYSSAPASPQPGYHPDIALAWLEAVTDSKLEFVRFNDLNLWFKAALRVRESNGRHNAGDLIVLLNGQLFESLDQAVVALKPSTRRGHSDTQWSVVLPGGLTGQRQQERFTKWWEDDYLEPGPLGKACVRLEIRMKREGVVCAETQYITGTCVSPEGLVVIPISSQSLVTGESMVVFGTIKGTASVVASNDQRGLTLVKLHSPNQQLFSWLKCRTGMPTKGQRLIIRDDKENNDFSAHDTSVTEAGLALPKPLSGNDAFVVHTHRNVMAPIGAQLISVENELQGIVLESMPYAIDADSDKQELKRHVAIPAIHVEKLIDDYRKAAAQQTRTHAVLEALKVDITIDAEAASKLIWENLGLKFGEPVTAEKLGPQGSKYRGGLPIVEVRDAGSAQKNQIRKGDVLVGLDKWETTSPDNVVWILKQSEAGHQQKFFVVRGDETRYGMLSAEVQIADRSKYDRSRSTPKSLDELLAILQNDRDSNHVTSALIQLRNMNLGADAGRVATAIFAAMEFHDPFKAPVKGNPPVGYLAAEAIRPIPRSIKIPLIVHVMKDGHPRAKVIAIRSLNDEAPKWEYGNEPDLPVLAELLFAAATGEDMEVRSSALNFLASTLPITKLDPADLTTEERGEAVRRLASMIPREKVLQLITDAANSPHIEAVLSASYLLQNMPEQLREKELSEQLVTSLTAVVEGKFHDVIATTSQRGQALHGLAMLRNRATQAVPVLIELLKSGDLEDGNTRNNSDPLQNWDEFTRRKVIATLGTIGPSAKAALPILEAELTALEKKEREDILLSGNAQSPSTAITSTGFAIRTLQSAIRSIKGQARTRNFGNRDF